MRTAQHIKDLRLQNGYTQCYIAEEIKVSQKTYSNMECGKTKITLAHLKKLSKFYKMSLVECIELVDQAEGKTSNAFKKEDSNAEDHSEHMDGHELYDDLIVQLKEHIGSLKQVLDSKDHTIKQLKTEIETLKKKTA